LEVSEFSEAYVIGTADYYTVVDVDTEELSTALKFTADPDVSFGWGWVTTGVIVNNHHRVGAVDDRSAEYLPCMDDHLVQSADGYQHMTCDPTPGVQRDADEALLVWAKPRRGGDLLPPVPDYP
jgi:hypothetical protein